MPLPKLDRWTESWQRVARYSTSPRRIFRPTSSSGRGSVPVVLLFWADQLPPAKDARRVLETLAGQYQGKFALALSDVSRDQSLAQHLRVQGLPSIRVIQDGQLIDQMEGPQGERALRAMLDRLTMTSGELLREQLDGVLGGGRLSTARSRC